MFGGFSFDGAGGVELEQASHLVPVLPVEVTVVEGVAHIDGDGKQGQHGHQNDKFFIGLWRVVSGGLSGCFGGGKLEFGAAVGAGGFAVLPGLTIDREELATMVATDVVFHDLTGL